MPSGAAARGNRFHRSDPAVARHGLLGRLFFPPLTIIADIGGQALAQFEILDRHLALLALVGTDDDRRQGAAPVAGPPASDAALDPRQVVVGLAGDLDQAIAMAADSAEAYYVRGMAREEDGDVEGALADFNAAVERDAEYALALEARGRRLWAKGDTRGAALDLERAAYLAPFDPSPRAALGLASASRARALLNGRIHASFEDVRALALPVLRHRIHLDYSARVEGMTTRQLVGQLLEEITDHADQTPASLTA